MFLCLVFLMLSRLFIAALWSPAGKGLTSWLLLLMFIVILILSHVMSNRENLQNKKTADFVLLSLFMRTN